MPLGAIILKQNSAKRNRIASVGYVMIEKKPFSFW